MSEENSLDKIAHLFPNKITSNIDLSPYMSDEVKHSVKPAEDYQDELIRLLIGEDDAERGTPLPWGSLKGRFEFRASEMTLWTGYKGHGKSAMLSQALNACMVRNEKVFIISPEFRPAKVLERLLYQRLCARHPTKDDLVSWMAWATKRLWLYDIQSSLKPNDVIALCRYVVKELGVNHILIDSLMKCGIGTDDYTGQKNFVDKVQNVAHTNPVHIHLVAHARKGSSGDGSPPGLHDVKGTSEIADMVENVVAVWRNKDKEKEKANGLSCKLQDEPDAQIVIEAQRNADGWIGSIPLFYDPQSMLFYEIGHAPERMRYVDF
jgi:twinkle protein